MEYKNQICFKAHNLLNSILWMSKSNSCFRKKYSKCKNMGRASNKIHFIDEVYENDI